MEKLKITTAENTAENQHDELEQFMSIYPQMFKDIISSITEHELSAAGERLQKVLLYNVLNGKHLRGLLIVITYKSLLDASGTAESAEHLLRVQHLGWCTELFHSGTLMADDIMDHGEIRRGAPCWYKVDNVGLHAINDTFIVTSTIFIILKQHFSDQPYYTSLLELFTETIAVTYFGESLDLESEQTHIECFTSKLYTAIARNKTAYYTFYLPIALAMVVSGNDDPESGRLVKKICIKIGCLFQVQDDYQDCYGDPVLIGKIGNDIENKKLTWLSVVCLEQGTENQKKVMRDNYGFSDQVKTQRIKDLYEEMDCRQKYAVYKKEQLREIGKLIKQLPPSIPHSCFNKIINMTFQQELQ